MKEIPEHNERMTKIIFATVYLYCVKKEECKFYKNQKHNR